VGWFGALVPAATPDSVIATYYAPVLAMKQDKAFLDKISTMGASVIPGGSAEAEKFIQDDIRKWACWSRSWKSSCNRDRACGTQPGQVSRFYPRCSSANNLFSTVCVAASSRLAG